MARVRGRGRRDLKSEINIVPLLDVLLVLLLIFMATAPIITQSVEVDLPDATDSKTVSSDDNPPVIVEVSGVGPVQPGGGSRSHGAVAAGTGGERSAASHRGESENRLFNRRRKGCAL